jgi:hypothetical protein
MGSVMSNVVDSILELLTETTAFVHETEDGPLANATAAVLQAMHLDCLIGQREDWVYQTIMRSLVETGALGISVQEFVSLRTHRPN